MATDCSPGVGQHSADIMILNQKMLAEDTLSDISINRKSLLRHQDAWETLRLHDSGFRVAFANALLAAVAIANQTGSTEDQQSVTPIRSGIGDAMAAAAYPANRAVDTATAGQAVNADTVNAAVAQAFAVNNPILAAAIGDAVAAAVSRAINPTASTTQGTGTGSAPTAG